MTDFLLSANWILILGFVGAAACLLYEFYNGGKVDLDNDPMPKWLWSHYHRRRR